MKTADIRKLSDEDLGKRLGDAREELMNLRFQHATGALENSSRLSVVRRDVARLLTVSNERSAMAATTTAKS